MDFAQPNYLALLILAPLVAIVLIWSTRRRRADLARLGTPFLITALSGSVSRKRRRWKTALWFFALVAMIIALARPRWGTQVQVTAQRGVQVMVVLDVSSSMLAEDIKPNRLDRAKLTVEELMNHLGGNELGLVPFAGAAFVQFPLTADFNTARSFLRTAGPWTISRPGTALGEALRVALKGFPKEIATNRVILLLTDGEGHEGDPIAAATASAEDGVTIYAIGFGSPEGEPIPIRDQNGALTDYKRDAQGQVVLSHLDEHTLQQIVDTTGGLYFRASASGDEIPTITDAIAALDTGDMESQFETRGVERFEWFAGLALATLVAQFLIGDRVISRTRRKSRTAGAPHVSRPTILTVLIAFLLLVACAPDVVHHNNTGNEHFDEGAYDMAITEYRQAQVDDPDRAEPYYNAANTFNRQKQFDAAQAQAQQALKTAYPDLASQTWYNLGNAHFDAESWSEAVAAYQEALRINPGDADAKHNLELALQKLEEQEQQQQEQNQQQEESEQENQTAESTEQSGTGAPTPTPANPPEDAENQDQSTTESATEEQQAQKMTPEQALQLLQALIGDSETLQERLQEIYRVPGPPPEQDW